MSTAEVSPEHAPSRPAPNPLAMARAHQVEIKRLSDKISAEAGCIRQLLVGRDIMCNGRFYKVIEVRMSVGRTISVYGVERGKKRRSHIGTLGEISGIAKPEEART